MVFGEAAGGPDAGSVPSVRSRPLLLVLLWAGPEFCVSTGVFGPVTNQRGPSNTFTFFFFLACDWEERVFRWQQPAADVRPRPKVAVTFRPERFCDSSQREILEVWRTLEFPLGRITGLNKYFPPPRMHSLVRFHSGLTKRSPENHRFPSDVSAALAACL